MNYIIHLKGEKDSIKIDSQAQQLIQSAQSQKMNGVWIDSQYISLSSIRHIVPDESPKFVPLLMGGMDTSIASGLSDSERKRKMKIMAQAYVAARAVGTEISATIRRYLDGQGGQPIPIPVVVRPKHIAGFSTPGEILTPDGVKSYSNIPF